MPSDREIVDSAYDETTLAIVTAIRDLCQDFDDPYWSKCDEEKRYPSEFVSALASGGWLGLTISSQYGGSELGHTQAAAVLHEVAASGAGINGCIPLHMPMFATASLVTYGSDELKRRFLPEICSGERTICFAVTEPDAGSDTSKITTRAVPNKDGWSLSGQKIWITQSLQAQSCILLARTGPAKSGRFDGLSLFFADLDDRFVEKRPISKMPHNALASCELFFSDLPVTRDRLIGEEGRGFYHVLKSLNSERTLMAAEIVGLGRAALKRGVEYAQARQVFSRPIGANQAISHPLARAGAMLSASWLCVMDATRRIDQGKDAGAASNMAKYLSAEACYAAADAALQAHGGMGFAREYHVERYFREARLLRTAPVSQEMTLNYLAQTVLGLPRSY
nr:acyl-CoA dehydrogenase family protein [Microvirga zambiensis]